MDREKLEAAAQRGIISPGQVTELLDFFASDTAEPGGENGGEQLRFIRSFGDVFITLGIVLVSFAVSKVQAGGYANLVPLVILLGLTEWLVGLRRLALPGIALLASILYFSDRALMGLPMELGLVQLVASIGMIVISGLFYLRYKMPFAYLAMAAGLLLFIHRFLGLDATAQPLLYAVYGAAVFLVAMWFDAKDVKRQNHYSDTGFWLHMLAAPLVARGVMFWAFQSGFETPLREILVIGFFLTFFLVALFVDRRALMVSSLLFAVAAVLNLFKMELLQNMDMIWLVFTILGLVMIVVGVNWYAIRRMIFTGLERDGLARLVPSFAAASKGKG